MKAKKDAKDVTKMEPRSLAMFVCKILAKADIRTMVHGIVMTERKGQKHTVSGFCGCAVGMIALKDGTAFRRGWENRSNQSEHFPTEDWKAGTFGAWLFASVSRAFERTATGERMYGPQRAAVRPADLERAQIRARLILMVLEEGASADDCSRFKSIDPDFGSYSMA
jgi:hypothetical protein